MSLSFPKGFYATKAEWRNVTQLYELDINKFINKVPSYFINFIWLRFDTLSTCKHKCSRIQHCTSKPSFMSVCFTPFCFNVPYQFTQLLNLSPLIIGLTPYLRLCVLHPLFPEHKQGVKQGPGVLGINCVQNVRLWDGNSLTIPASTELPTLNLLHSKTLYSLVRGMVANKPTEWRKSSGNIYISTKCTGHEIKFYSVILKWDFVQNKTEFKSSDYKN